MATVISQVPPPGNYALGVFIIVCGGVVLALSALLAIRDFIDAARGTRVLFFYGCTRLGAFFLVQPILHLLLKDTPYGPGYRFVAVTSDSVEYAAGLALLVVGLMGVVFNYRTLRDALARRRSDRKGKP